jgi:hypothetical protein
LEHSYPRPWYSCSVSRCWKTSRHRIWEASIPSVRALRTSRRERTGQHIPTSHPGETGTIETLIPAVLDGEGEDACGRAFPPAGPEAPIQHRPRSVRTAAKLSDSTAGRLEHRSVRWGRVKGDAATLRPGSGQALRRCSGRAGGNGDAASVPCGDPSPESVRSIFRSVR